MNSIKCLKDWIVEGNIIFQKGENYQIDRKERCMRANGIMVKPNKKEERSYWFWSGSDYFDVDSLFGVPILN